jgi:hypothetical protein
VRFDREPVNSDWRLAIAGSSAALGRVHLGDHAKRTITIWRNQTGRLVLPFRLLDEQDPVEGAQRGAAEEFPAVQDLRSGDA